MASDRLITAEHILKAVMEYDRRGSRRVLSEWEKLEPDMAEFLMESLTRLYHRLTDLGLAGSDARKVLRRAEKSALVCVIAQRNAHRELWERDQGEPPSSPTDAPPLP